MSQLIDQIINRAKQAMTLEMAHENKYHQLFDIDHDASLISLNCVIRYGGKVDAFGDVLDLLGIDIHKYEEIKNKHGYYDRINKIFKDNAEEFKDEPRLMKREKIVEIPQHMLKYKDTENIDYNIIIFYKQLLSFIQRKYETEEWKLVGEITDYFTEASGRYSHRYLPENREEITITLERVAPNETKL